MHGIATPLNIGSEKPSGKLAAMHKLGRKYAELAV
jgi:hypothetical protein